MTLGLKPQPRLDQLCLLTEAECHARFRRDSLIPDTMDRLKIQLVVGLDRKKRMFLRSTASAVASASTKSFLWTSQTALRAELPREFVFNGSRIPDPGPQMSIDRVRDLLTPSYPEIATATMTGPEDTGTNLRYSFSRAIGSKG
jgi:PRTRC genetic system protein C